MEYAYSHLIFIFQLCSEFNLLTIKINNDKPIREQLKLFLILFECRRSWGGSRRSQFPYPGPIYR